MGAVLILMILVLVTVNLVITVSIWKGRKKMSASKVSGVPVFKEEKQQFDIDDVVKKTVEAMQQNADESGEEETMLTEDELQDAMRAVMGAMKR